MVLPLVIVVLALAAAGYGALHYMTAVPGKPHRGPLPPLTPEEAVLAQSLARHIATIAAREHNVAHYEELEKVARYIEATLASFGYLVGRQEFLTDGKPVRNIEVAVEPARASADPEVIVVGAHYDSVFGSPGANDNASGAAAVIELTRLLRDLDAVGGKRNGPARRQRHALGADRFALVR
jgi:acetylornithine deacetylase/succinyl-diaminopimelate desuccinylase-like protein